MTSTPFPVPSLQTPPDEVIEGYVSYLLQILTNWFFIVTVV